MRGRRRGGSLQAWTATGVVALAAAGCLHASGGVGGENTETEAPAVCLAPAVMCGLACVDLATDPANCGACDQACPAAANAAPVCVDGGCSFACVGAFLDCNGVSGDGCEADTTSSLTDCSVCGAACPEPPHATPSCVMGACSIQCAPGFADCNGDIGDGCEVSLGDVHNCGACGHACSAGPNADPTCAVGTCGVQCAAGFADCDGDAANGCEAELAHDGAHCGACGTTCSSPGVCVAGACIVPSFDVNDGPQWDTAPPALSCMDACALLFGGKPKDWACSIDPSIVTHTAWASDYLDADHCPGGTPVAEDYKVCSAFSAAGCVSAYVKDWCFGGATNYCTPKQ